MLGAIKRIVDSPQNGGAGGAVLRKDCNAKRECDSLKDLPCEFEMELFGTFAN